MKVMSHYYIPTPQTSHFCHTHTQTYTHTHTQTYTHTHTHIKILMY